MDKDKLWVQAFRAKYLQHQDLLIANNFKNGMWVWCGIVKMVPQMRKGPCYLAWNRRLPIIESPSLPTTPPFKLVLQTN